VKADKRALVLVLLLLLAACAGGRGDVATARSLAEGYLSQLADATVADRGWARLLPDSRRAYADENEYLTLVASADWDSFRWRLVGEGDYCEDGGVYCVVRLDVAGAPESVPAFLLEPPGSRPDDRFSTLRLDDDGEVPGNAEIIVYFTPGGPRGILLGGG